MRKISYILILLLTLFCTAFMTACGDPDITEPTTVLSLSDLPGKSIGVLKDSPADLAASVLEHPASDQTPAVIVRYKKLDDAVKDLKKAKLDCVILDSFSAAHYYMENGKLAVLEDAFSWQEYSICLNNSSFWLQEEINRVLALMDEDGTLLRIHEKYADGMPSEEESMDMEVYEGEQVLRVLTGSDRYPYVYTTSEGQLAGIEVDIAREICHRLDYELMLEEMDTENIFREVAAGEAELGIAALSLEMDPTGECIFTDSYSFASQQVLIRNIRK